MLRSVFSKSLMMGLALAFSASQAQAHRMWMLPSTYTLSGETQTITVDGAVSNDLFFPNHVPLSLKDTRVYSPDGKVTPVSKGWTGKNRMVFDVTLDQQGTYRLSETGKMYFASWKEGGEEKRSRGTLETLKKKVKGKGDVKMAVSARRVEAYVTLGNPSSKAFEREGKGIELAPVTHPNDIFVGEPVRFKLYFNGKPASGFAVNIMKGHDRYRDNPDLSKIKTDAEGLFSFTPEEAGRYWINSSTAEMGLVDGKPGRKMFSFSATIEALE